MQTLKRGVIALEGGVIASLEIDLVGEVILALQYGRSLKIDLAGEVKLSSPRRPSLLGNGRSFHAIDCVKISPALLPTAPEGRSLPMLKPLSELTNRMSALDLRNGVCNLT